MGTVHDLIESHGKQAALLMAADRPSVEAAASYMADDNTAIGFLHSGWCQAALPHRRLPDNSKGWQIVSEHVTLIVEPGMRPGAQDAEHVGVPYGSRARLIMLYLQSEALRTQSRQVELGRSMRDWLSRMSVPIGGKSLIAIREQAMRISRCRLSLNIKASGGRTGLVQQNIVDDAIFLDQADTGQGSLFVETANLSEKFFLELQRHPVPLEEAAVRALSNNSMALDLYAWLAYRLHVLKGTTPVSWSALKGQFGTGFSSMRHFRETFLSNLRLALAVYREARVEVVDRGMDLYPSPPPVKPRQVAVITHQKPVPVKSTPTVVVSIRRGGKAGARDGCLL